MMNSHVFFFDSMHAAGIVWALFKLVLMCSLHLYVNNLQSMPNVDCGSPCITCMVIVGIWVTNALIMLLNLAHLGSPLATMSPRVGLDTTLTLPNVSMGATASVKLSNDFNAFEQTLRHQTRPGFSIGTSHRVPCVHCAPFVCSCHVSYLLSAFCSCFLWIIALPTSDGSTFFIRVYCIEY